jgi:two-component system CheB/CheR fusion protein
VLDSAFCIVTANTAFYQTIGADPQRTEGRSLFDLGEREWDIPELREMLEQVLPASHVVSDFEVTQDVDGARRAWMLNARRLLQEDTAPPLILLALEDVSERNRLERVRRQYVDKLAAADLAKDQFLAMLGHELRSPLGPIGAAAEILSRLDVPPAASAQARVIIDRQVKHRIRLIDELLDVARITLGKIDLRLAATDLTAVLRRAVEVVEHHVRERDQLLVANLPSGPWCVLGDTVRLEQAFTNLLNNASKFTRRGGHIWLTAERTESGTGKTEPGEHRAEALVRVRDDGTGIGAESLANVFDLFKQSGQSPHYTSGLGVGLALVRRVIELHGGRVSVQSGGLNQGSEFLVAMPLNSQVL